MEKERVRDGFIVYKSWYNLIEDLDLEKKGMLLDAIFKYQTEGLAEVDPGINGLFKFFKSQFDQDWTKYVEMCEKNKENIQKRYAKDYDRIRPNTTEYECIPKDKDKDNEKDNDKDNEKGWEKDGGIPAAPLIFFIDSKIIEEDIKQMIEATPGINGIDANKYAKYYYKRARDWSEEKAEKKRNWMRTIQNWIEEDLQQGKIKIKKEGKSYDEIRNSRGF